MKSSNNEEDQKEILNILNFDKVITKQNDLIKKVRNNNKAKSDKTMIYIKNLNLNIENNQKKEIKKLKTDNLENRNHNKKSNCEKINNLNNQGQIKNIEEQIQLDLYYDKNNNDYLFTYGNENNDIRNNKQTIKESNNINTYNNKYNYQLLKDSKFKDLLELMDRKSVFKLDYKNERKKRSYIHDHKSYGYLLINNKNDNFSIESHIHNREFLVKVNNLHNIISNKYKNNNDLFNVSENSNYSNILKKDKGSLNKNYKSSSSFRLNLLLQQNLSNNIISIPNNNSNTSQYKLNNKINDDIFMKLKEVNNKTRMIDFKINKDNK